MPGPTYIEVDGACGEGGGQILRTSLALSMITRKPLRMTRIRAGRAKPGLRHQHLACVEAAADLCGAETHGARVGSQSLEFIPPERGEWAVELDVNIGTAGSTSLVLQTVLVPAIASGRALDVTVHGGTHNPMAPPFDFLARAFVPQLRAMGADVTLELERHGFASGPGPSHDDRVPKLGKVKARIGASGKLRAIDVVDAGPVVARHATSVLGRLPTHVGDRELGEVVDQLGWSPDECEIREVREGTGNVLMLEVERANGVRELVSELGQKGLPAEVVADRAIRQMRDYLDLDAPVGEHLADQLLLPMAVAGGGAFRSAPLSSHATTNIDTIQQFLDVAIRVERDGATSVVTVG